MRPPNPSLPRKPAQDAGHLFRDQPPAKPAGELFRDLATAIDGRDLKRAGDLMKALYKVGYSVCALSGRGGGR